VNAGTLVAVCAAITSATGQAFVARQARQAAGGSIHNSHVLEAGDRRYFVKTNIAASAPQFGAEAKGLASLSAANCVRVPEVICEGMAADGAFLVLEFLALKSPTAGGQERLGHALAALHAAGTMTRRFGLDYDNFIGATQQSNAWCNDWVEFFRARRLQPQLELAASHGYGKALAPGELLLQNLGGLFTGYQPGASLLHGDLWSGNAGELEDGTPALFDPAVYFGDRESDVAMTGLFGGFTAGFYAAYNKAWPLAAGYRVRRTLYQLYHVLNHLNLFGTGYLAQAQHMIAQLNAELG
jgi:fructosamine-3-kinase